MQVYLLDGLGSGTDFDAHRVSDVRLYRV
jgi:hypothetical protein